MNQEAHTYRCFALMRPDGGWRRWTFAPDRQKTLDRMQALSRGDVLFSSVQAFPRPANMVGYLKWRDVCEQYRGENPLPHIAPLYFDIDCAEGLGGALTLTHALHDFFTVELGVAPAHIRAWFSGSKGAHLLVHPDALGIQPSPTLTSDMKPIVVHLCHRHDRHRVPRGSCGYLHRHHTGDNGEGEDDRPPRRAECRRIPTLRAHVLNGDTSSPDARLDALLRGTHYIRVQRMKSRFFRVGLHAQFYDIRRSEPLSEKRVDFVYHLDADPTAHGLKDSYIMYYNVAHDPRPFDY